MQEPQSLTPTQLLERANRNRIGNPRHAEQDYLRAAEGKSLPAFFQLITDYETGFYDGVKDTGRANELIIELATLLQNNYQQLLTTDSTAVANLNKDIAHFLQNYSEKLSGKPSLLEKLKIINDHLSAINLLNTKQEGAALTCFENMAVSHPWCRVELAKAAMNGLKDNTVNLEQAFTESVLAFEYYISLINNKENIDRHIALASLESVRIIYNLSNSLNNGISDQVRRYLSRAITKKSVANILNTYVNHQDTTLNVAAREIIISYLNPDLTRQYAEELIAGVKLFSPVVKAKDTPKDIEALYTPFKDFLDHGTPVPAQFHDYSVTRLMAIEEPVEQKFFARKAIAMIQDKGYLYEYHRVFHEKKADPDCFHRYLEAYRIHQDDVEIVHALIRLYRTKIHNGEQQYILPYISLLGNGLINCHSPECLQILKAILSSSAWMTFSHKTLIEFYIGYYYFKNNRHPQAFIIFKNLVSQHLQRRVESSVAEMLFSDLTDLSAALQKNEMYLAKQLLELAVAFQPQHGLTLLFTWYVQGFAGIPENIYRDDLINQIAASVWQQSKESTPIKRLKSTKQLLTEFNDSNVKRSEQITSCWTGIMALEAGLEKEKHARRVPNTNNAQDYCAAMKEFETAHTKKIMLGTLKLGIAYELNYQGSGANVAEAINLYKTFLAYPLIRSKLIYLPAIEECLERLFELSLHPRPDIHKLALEVLLAKADLCSDAQIKKLLQQFSNTAVRLVCFEQLMLRQDLLRNMPTDIILELAAFGSPQFKQAAHATLLASSEHFFNTVIKIAETPNHPYIAQANNVVGLMARSGKVAAIYKIQPWRNDNLIMLRSFLLALQGGCADALLNILPVIEALLNNPRTISDANRDLPTILKIALEKGFLDKLHETEKPLLIAVIARLKLHKDISKPAMYSLDQIFDKIGLPVSRRKFERSEEVDESSTTNPQLTRSGSPLHVSSPSSGQKHGMQPGSESSEPKSPLSP